MCHPIDYLRKASKQIKGTSTMLTFPQTSSVVKSYIDGYLSRFDYSNYLKSDSLPISIDDSFDYYFCGSVANLLNQNGDLWIIARDLYQINGIPVIDGSYVNGFLVNCHTGMVLTPYIDYYRKTLAFNVYGLSYEENRSVQPISSNNTGIKFSKFPFPKRLVNRINSELLTTKNIEALALYQSQMLRKIESDNICRNTLIDLSLEFGFNKPPSEYELKQNRLSGYPGGRERVEISARYSDNDVKVKLELDGITLEQAKKIAAILGNC